MANIGSTGGTTGKRNTNTARSGGGGDDRFAAAQERYMEASGEAPPEPAQASRGSRSSSEYSTVAGGLANLYGEISGANRAADAAEAAAILQQQTAREERALILAEGRKQQERANTLANATPQELQAFEAQLAGAMKQLETRQRMIEAIDPAIMEASEQVLKILRGEEAGVTSVANEQRMTQRQQLVDSLRSQYGPGAESSSIGQKALQQFDSQTNMLTAQNQQNALSSVFGIASGAEGLTSMNNALVNLQSAGGSFSNLQQRRLNTELQTGSNILSGLAGTSQAQIQSAGAQYVGEAIKANNQQQLVGGITTAALSSYFGTPTPAPGKS